MNKKEYTNYGTFKVTTEGDCEGRNVLHDRKKRRKRLLAFTN